MTREEKLQLQAAKRLYETSNADQRYVLESLFPELAELEDARIRKEIISALKWANHKGVYDKHIDWLEKQGENVSLPKFTFDDVLALQCCMETTKKIQEDKELYEQLQSLHDRLHDAYWLEKQGEQKPTDEDKIEALRSEYEKGRADAIAEMQVAWSEEDEMIALSIEQVINCASLLNIVPEKIDKIRTWLKSLKQRI